MTRYVYNIWIKFQQQVQMNEGKSKLEAMRRNLKKKANNSLSLQNTNSNGGQENGQTQGQTSNNKIPIEQRLEKVQKAVQKDDKGQEQKLQLNKTPGNEDKVNSLLFNDPKKKQSQQALEQGQIEEEQEKKSNEQKQEIVHAKFVNTQNHQNDLIVSEKDMMINPILSQPKEIQKPLEINLIIPQSKQKIMVPQLVSNADFQEGQLKENGNEQKNIIISQEKHEKPIQNEAIIEEEAKQSHQANSNQIIQKKAIQEEQKVQKEPIRQNIVLTQNNQIINNNKTDESSADKQLQKTNSNDSLKATQSLNLQASISQNNNSTHLPQRKGVHNNACTSSNKPVIKVVLKQLQMIKSTIHNLNVTYRGVQYLRERIKNDVLLKRKIKQRLIDLSGDNQMDVLRKLVKKVQQTSSSGNQKPTSMKQTKPTPVVASNPLLTNKQSISQKIISQPQIPISNQAIEY